ncbi:unnamed protein product [Chironomus riparius]|uniref:Uncharacterized protein n=1 Tax=Chironomus riparius TaxID=315576 RepID=A0A9N9RSA0_9DIPT|nr:unnamed protein product [Chironomus riparius]
MSLKLVKMSKKVCIICLVCEATTRLFCMQSAHNEDERRYECLTGIKLKCPAFICQRCSIDLGLASNLKQKALESSRLIKPSLSQFKVPVNKNLPATNHSQMPINGVTITPITTQTSINKTEKSENQNVQPSSKTAIPLSSTMSRTDKIMSSASIISSTVVNPPMDMSKITDLFKTKPNISVIKTKHTEDEHKGTKDPPKEQFPRDDDEKKLPVNYNSRITKRRQTVCAKNFNDLQENVKSQAGMKLGNFQPTILVSKTIVKTENDKKCDKKPAAIKQEKASKKRQAEEIVEKDKKKPKLDENSSSQVNQSQNKYTMRNRDVKTPEHKHVYWVKSKADGYNILTFKSLVEAEKYFEKLSPDATYGPL